MHYFGVCELWNYVGIGEPIPQFLGNYHSTTDNSPEVQELLFLSSWTPLRGAESAVKTQNFPKRKTYFEKFPHSKIFLKIFRLHNFSKISLDQKIFPKRAFPHTGRFFTTGLNERELEISTESLSLQQFKYIES